MNAKYNIDEKCNGGKIVGILESGYYTNKMLRSESKDRALSMFEKRCNNWKNKPIYIIKYDYHKPICTFEEFKDQCPQIKEEFLEQEYNKSVLMTDHTVIPEELIQLDL